MPGEHPTREEILQEMDALADQLEAYVMDMDTSDRAPRIADIIARINHLEHLLSTCNPPSSPPNHRTDRT